MTAHAESWWYSLVSASPLPEAGEAVNIGIVTGNGTPRDLRYMPGLPRLVGLLPQSELMMYEDLLDRVRARITSETSLDTLRVLVGPQVQFSQPKGLLVEPSERIIDILQRKFLQRPQGAVVRELRDQRLKAGDLVDQRISGLLTAGGLRYERRVSLGALSDDLAGLARQHRVPGLSRAVIAQRRIVLLDSVVVEGRKETEAIRLAASKIGKAFWLYRRLRDEIHSIAGVDIRTVGIIGLAAHGRDQEVSEAGEYIKHLWQQDADAVIDDGNPASHSRLAEELQWVSA
ncbi:MAG TPA: hypothetical protein VFI39_01390 [Gemmatimonadales bacterium]|nr:hypothetical protein [Gemmatimonadales bacterium]